MQTLGQQLKDIRKRKGLTQEELADEAKINLRTIQRIENNNSEPRGKTLSLICNVLDVNIEELLDYGKTEDDSYLIALHLSVLSFMILPLGNIVLPLLLWMNKKDKIIGLRAIGAKILNFQILWTVLAFTSILSWALLKIMHWSYVTFFLYAIIFLYALNVSLPIVFALKIRKGNPTINYPQLIKILR